MRESNRETCSNLNNEFRAANIKFNEQVNLEIDAENTISSGNGNISGYEYEITQINVQLIALEVGGFVGGRAIGIVSAGRIAQLNSKKQKLEDQIAKTKNDIEEAKNSLRDIRHQKDLQARIMKQIEEQRKRLAC